MRRTCFSESLRQDAISILRRRDKYMLAANSRSSSRSWVLVKAVRIRLHEPPLFDFWRTNTGLGLRLVVVAPPLIGEHDVTCVSAIGECVFNDGNKSTPIKYERNKQDRISNKVSAHLVECCVTSPWLRGASSSVWRRWWHCSTGGTLRGTPLLGPRTQADGADPKRTGSCWTVVSPLGVTQAPLGGTAWWERGMDCRSKNPLGRTETSCCLLCCHRGFNPEKLSQVIQLDFSLVSAISRFSRRFSRKN